MVMNRVRSMYVCEQVFEVCDFVCDSECKTEGTCGRGVCMK